MANVNVILVGREKIVVYDTTSVKHQIATVMDSVLTVNAFVFVDSKGNSAKKVSLVL